MSDEAPACGRVEIRPIYMVVLARGFEMSFDVERVQCNWTTRERWSCVQGCQMMPSLANTVKYHCFPKDLPICFGNIF